MRDRDDARLCDDSHEDTRAQGPLRALMQAFRVLHRIEWSAPWTAEERPFRAPCRS